MFNCGKTNKNLNETFFLSEKGISLATKDLPKDPEFGTLPARITITHHCPKASANVNKEALRKIAFTHFQYDLVDNTTADHDQEPSQATSTESTVTVAVKPRSNICKAIDIVKRTMEKLNVRLYRGLIFKKAPMAKFSYVKSCSVMDFLHSLLCNPQIAELLTPHLAVASNILSHEGCTIVRQIVINYDLVEVKPFGTCFCFSEKTFKADCFSDNDVGKITPRAYVSYTYKENVVPYPRIFVQSLRNSFPSEEQFTKFLRKWYQLALKGQYPQKTKKLCCVGDADSGKTSWFAPYEGIISKDKIAAITRDNHFSATMMTEETEALFVDEWPPDALSADDAKRVLQGGYLAIHKKHRDPVHFIYNSGAYITCNEIPPFSDTDMAAISARLDIFATTSLPEKNPHATNWFRINCMQCFHYAAERLKGYPLWDNENIETNETAAGDEGAIFSDFCNTRASNLVAASEIESLEFSQSFDLELGEAAEEVAGDTIPRMMRDRAIVSYEDSHPEEWQRTPSELFIVTGEHNDASYYTAVYNLSTCKEKWDSLGPDQDDLKRFQRRRRLGWDGIDSMFEAWLLIENTPREVFNLENFKQTFPGWEENMNALYGTVRGSSFIVEEHDSSSDEEDDVPLQAQR